MNRIAVVVLNWNGFSDTKQSIESLLKQDYTNFSIVVIENGSKDSSAKFLADLAVDLEDSRLHVIYNTKNLGFAGGVNTGIRYALNNNYDAVALFNNDAVADKGWLSSLVTASEDFDSDITTGLLLHQDGKTIDSTGDFYSHWGMPFPRNRGNDRQNAEKSSYVFGATGGASLYRTAVFRDIGLFDEKFFAYYEDVDISFRAQLAGYKVYYTKEAVAYHKQGAASAKIPGFTVYQTFKNIPLLFIKNVPARLFISIGLRFLLLYILIFGNAIKNGQGVYALKGWLMSIWYFFTRSLWHRFAIQRNKKVSWKYINDIIFHDLPPDQTGMRKLRKKLTGK